HLAVNRGNAGARTAFTVTLEKMARGGVYDQLAGGFHRYSVDERWIVPHFEKMLYDNSELLRNYVHGWQSLGREEFRETAREIVGWLDSTMTDRERGGFYASQDADVGLDDDGDYFTWTREETRAALDDAEFEFAADYWEINTVGDMHHNPAKNVLHVDVTLEERAAKGGPDIEALRRLRVSARRKLLAARAERTTPFIDRTLYTSWNAMAATAYFEAARISGMEGCRDFALQTVNRLLEEAWDGAAALRHVIAYPEGERPVTHALGTLDDYAFTIHACIDAWLASGEMKYYRAAVTLADAMIAAFYDRAGGGFFDTPATGDGTGQAALGALSARRKPFQDSPTPAGNPTAASALLRLEALSGREDYRNIAQDTLACFAGVAEHFGLYAGAYGLALERLLLDPVQAIVIGAGPEAEELESTANADWAANKTVIRIDLAHLAPGQLPEAIQETVLAAPAPAGAKAWALVCRGRTCLPPVSSAEGLRQALHL
ncbi:MAG: thioredoxin domain-containing protein, partial [Terracidiphilus sp.]